jgi:hypothetical protein
MIVVTPCGRKKAARARYAGDLYVGGFFRHNLRYALSIADQDHIFILSAKHGLIRPGKWLEPYNVMFGMPGSITVEQVRQQAVDLGIADETAFVLGLKEYVRHTENVFRERVLWSEWVKPELSRDVGTLYAAISWLSRNRGRLPPELAASDAIAG